MPGGPKIADGSRQLLLNKFFDPSTPSMRKEEVKVEEKKRKVEERKRRVKITVYYRRASQPREWQPTGTLTVPANCKKNLLRELCSPSHGA